jgi:hypothetical protein
MNSSISIAEGSCTQREAIEIMSKADPQAIRERADALPPWHC